MKTTMVFDDRSDTRINSSYTFGGAGSEAISMDIYRTKERFYFADRNTLVYDDETGHLRVGHGSSREMESVSGIRSIKNISKLPAKGKIDTLYFCLDNGYAYVWNNNTGSYVPIMNDILDKLSLKADRTYVDAKLSTKADATYVNNILNTKADKAYVDAHDSQVLADGKNYTDNKVSVKADKSYVDAIVAAKADKTYVNAKLNTKADRLYVDNAMGLKADKTYVDGKADTAKTYTDNILKEAKKYADNKMAIMPAATESVRGGVRVGSGLTINGDVLSVAAQQNAITGVKGDTETSYRTGNVNITKANIGLSNVNNTADSEKNVKYAANAGKVNNLTVEKAVPADAKFTDTTYSNFVKSGSGAKAGLVPAPPTVAGTAKYLREDGTWQTPPGATYTAASAAPKANGTAAVGTSAKYAREDHVHPLQTSVSGSSGSCTGNAATASKIQNKTIVCIDSFDKTNGILKLLTL